MKSNNTESCRCECHNKDYSDFSFNQQKECEHCRPLNTESKEPAKPMNLEKLQQEKANNMLKQTESKEGGV